MECKRICWAGILLGAIFTLVCCGPLEAVKRSTTPELKHDELWRSGSSNLYDAIRILRPHWLRIVPGRNRSRSHPVVVVNGMVFEDLDSLRDYSIEVVNEVRFLSNVEAFARYGARSAGPVIEISLLGKP